MYECVGNGRYLDALVVVHTATRRLLGLRFRLPNEHVSLVTAELLLDLRQALAETEARIGRVTKPEQIIERTDGEGSGQM